MSQISFTTTIHAPIEEVWLAFVEQTAEWWTKNLFSHPDTRKMEIEEWIGGKLFEDFGSREGLVWGDVIGIKKEKFILLRGQLSPEYGGPAISFTQFKFETDGDLTKLLFTEDWMGKDSKEFNQNMTNGWKDILNHLKVYVEGDNVGI